MDYHEIFKKLIGPIKPVGESHTDSYRYKALMSTSELAIELIHGIKEVSKNKDRVEFSMKQSGELAQNTLNVIKEIIGD